MASVIIFFNTVHYKPIYLCDESFLIHFSLQIKQNVYSIGTHSGPEATQILVKMYRKIAKVTFLKVFHFSVHQYFPNTKKSVARAKTIEYISQKRGKHQIVKLESHDRY